jgi:hypothetical protein
MEKRSLVGQKPDENYPDFFGLFQSVLQVVHASHSMPHLDPSHDERQFNGQQKTEVRSRKSPCPVMNGSIT